MINLTASCLIVRSASVRAAYSLCGINLLHIMQRLEAMLFGGCLLLLLAAQCGRTQLVGDNVQYRPGAGVETARNV